MDPQRRNFLKATSAAFLIAALPTFPQAATAQQTAQVEQQQQVSGRFDIRALRREMGLPEGTGPFLTVPVRVKPNIAVNQYALYEVTIDAGLLTPTPLLPEEIPAAQEVVRRQLGREMTPDEIQKSKRMRETIAFVQQFNIEIYMTPEQMKQHIDMYRNDNPANLKLMRDSFREDIKKNVVDIRAIIAITKHLIDYHGMEEMGVTTQSGEKVTLLKAVIEAREAAKRTLLGQPHASNTPAASPTASAG
jgi:hypothetical protein